MAGNGCVLIVEDDRSVREMVAEYLGGHGYEVHQAGCGADMRDVMAQHQPQVVLLDVRLPGEDGLTLARYLRERHDVGIIMVTAAGEVVDRVVGLEIGADDYVTKPFSTLELRARIKAQLRRAAAGAGGGNQEPVVHVHGLTVDLAARTVKRDGEEIHLTPTEWSLLRVFVAHPGQTLTHSQLFTAVWHDGAGDAQQYLRVYVGQLRRKLEVDPVRPRLIRTEPAVGYRFDPGG
jgi:DNA-binding response OmpR family regulator